MSAAGLGRQTGSLPGQDAAFQMGIVGQPLRLRRQRCGHRTAAGAAGEHHGLALGIGNVAGIERGQRQHHRIRISLRGHLVRLAHVDQQVTSVGDSSCDVSGDQIMDTMGLVRHAGLLEISLLSASRSGERYSTVPDRVSVTVKVSFYARKIKHRKGFMIGTSPIGPRPDLVRRRHTGCFRFAGMIARRPSNRMVFRHGSRAWTWPPRETYLRWNPLARRGMVARYVMLAGGLHACSSCCCFASYVVGLRGCRACRCSK